VRADAIPIDTAKRERFERTVTEKYEAGEGHLTPQGATPHPHRSLALSLPTACQVPTQAEADIAPPTSPTPAGFPETMAKKSFAWNFPRPKQWQKKAWLKFSSTRKRCAYVVHMTRVWFRIRSSYASALNAWRLQIHPRWRDGIAWAMVTAGPPCPKRRTEVL
jgi:hypothetical protein